MPYIYIYIYVICRLEVRFSKEAIKGLHSCRANKSRPDLIYRGFNPGGEIPYKNGVLVVNFEKSPLEVP